MQGLLSVVALLATILAQASPAASPGAPTGPDWTAIEVQRCAVLPRGERGLRTQGIEIDFVNRAQVAATDITFSVVYRGTPATIPDHGTFAPGTVIKHTYLQQYANDTFQGATPEICRVRHVAFANGTVSNAPAHPSEPDVPSP
jgi:hypothetical protein